jgi:2-amino-4-hydroxy-6-hydroxymethyldihydropteridine diphosphokinase
MDVPADREQARSLRARLGGARSERRRDCDEGCEDSDEEPLQDAEGSRYPRRVTRAYVGLGANLGDREASLRAAVERLGRTRGIEVIAVSSFRETEPVGYLDQPRFLNGAVALETELPPRALLDALLAVERSLGRTRDGPRFGPRTIDLDLLAYGEEAVDEPGLHVPHPRLGERAFALEPLLELEPALFLPGLGALETLLRKLESG